MIPFDIQGVMVEEPIYENKYVKFLIRFQNKTNNDITTIPISIFRNKFNVEYLKDQIYKIKGGFESIPIYKKGYILVYNAKSISLCLE